MDMRRLFHSSNGLREFSQKKRPKFAVNSEALY